MAWSNAKRSLAMLPLARLLELLNLFETFPDFKGASFKIRLPNLQNLRLHILQDNISTFTETSKFAFGYTKRQHELAPL
jgi:hypothetical protein